MNFGEKMTAARKKIGLSQQDLAKKLSTHPTLISRYEHNEVRPSIDVAKKIADTLGTTVDFLVNGSTSGDSLPDKQLVKRIAEIEKLPDEEKKSLFKVIDAFLRDAHTQKAYSK